MELVELNKICVIKNGFAFKSAEFKNEGIPLLRISNFDDSDVFINEKTVFVDEAFLKTKKDFIVEKGDILIALSGATTGKYGIYNFDFPSLLNQRVGLLKSGLSKKLNTKYFYQYLTVLKLEILRKAGGAAQPNISTKGIGELKIPLPPLETQKKIATILDEADKLRQLNKQLIQKYETLTQSLFLDMFGEYFKNEIGYKQIKDIATFIDYRGKTPHRVKSGIPLISAKCVRTGYFLKERLDYIMEETYEKSMTRGFPKIGDVLFTTEGATMGFTCRIPSGFDKFAVGQRLITLQTKDNYNSILLEFVLNYVKTQDEIFSLATGSAAKGIRSAKFSKIKIPVPPIQLQTQFAERVQEIEQQKEQVQKALQKSEDLFNSLLQKAFKGELVK